MLCKGFYHLVDSTLYHDGTLLTKPKRWGDVNLHDLWTALWLEGDPGECQVSEEESFEGLLDHDDERYWPAFQALEDETRLPAMFFHDLLYQDVETALLNLNEPAYGDD